MSKKLFIILILYTLILLFNINSIALFVGDERKYASSVEALFDGFVDKNAHPLFAKTIWYFFTYGLFSVFGVDRPLFWRLGTIVFSLATLVVFNKIARLMFTERLALIATVLLAFDPMYFAFSRTLQLEIFALFFILTALYFLLFFKARKNENDILKASFFLGLSLASKLSALLLAFVVPVFFSYTLLKRSKFFKAFKFNLFYFSVLFIAFVLGNIIFFFKETGSANFFEYTYTLFDTQFNSRIAATGFQASPPWSWITVPQIITMYRINLGERVEAVVAYQNPAMFLVSLVTIVATMFLFVKGKIKKRYEFGWILLFFSALYVPWFFNIHTTYYYYIIPSLPLIILMFINLVSLVRFANKILAFTLVMSAFSFFLSYPLLIGLQVPKTYEMTLFKYSRYVYPETNTIFCQNCSPRK